MEHMVTGQNSLMVLQNQAGTTSITVSSSTPSSLYYYCSVHSGMGGSITIGEDDGY
jgi:plastocyanin